MAGTGGGSGGVGAGRVSDSDSETNEDGTFSVYLWKHNYQWEEEVVDKDGMFIPEVKATVIVVDDSFVTTFGASPIYARSSPDMPRQSCSPMS